MASPRFQIQVSLDEAQKILEFTHGKTFAEFAQDELLRLAIERLLEKICDRIGLSIKALPGLRSEFPEIARMVGFRNRLAHEYDNIIIAIVWDIVQGHVPPLIASLALLAELDNDQLEQRYGG